MPELFALTQLPYREDPLARLAGQIIEQQQHRLPDLSHVVVLLPDLLPAARLRRLLQKEAAKKKMPCLLGPHISTLKQFIDSDVFLDKPILASDAAELMLVDALQSHGELFNHGNPWMLADALITLFDELNLYQCELPPSIDEFIGHLRKIYGTQAGALSIEAKIVHTLWIAWHEQLHAEGQVDLNTAYLLKLKKHAQQSNQQQFYLAGYAGLMPAEIDWVNAQLNHGCLQLLMHGHATEAESSTGYVLHQLGQQLQTAHAPEPDSGNVYTQWLDAVFCDDDTPIAERAKTLATQHPQSPAQNRLSILKTDQFEDEAKAVLLKVLHCKARNKQRIGLVIEDRRLARRLRALLDRHGIALRDPSGWALSTTSAAAALENWLEAVEEDFAYQPLLDLLKSPFVPAETSREEQLKHVHRLEQDIIRRENIARNIQRYRRAIESRKQRLQELKPIDTEALQKLLNKVAHAAQPLEALIKKQKAESSQWLEALHTSLERLGLDHGFMEDPAGKEMLLVLGDLQHAASQSRLRMSWVDFRTWLGRALEKQTFKPEDPHQQYVDLLHLPQSQLGHFEALIIAGVTQEYFPALDGGGPFFNNAVRAELGLPTHRSQLDMQLHHFRRLLEAAPEILLTCHQSDDALPAPWLVLLEAFEELGWGGDLQPRELEHWLSLPDDQLWPPQSALPHAATLPAPAIPSELYPDEISASSHQKLIECPYAFFAAYCLGLKAPDEVREALAKNDYGHRVHRCLEAFHQGLPGLPGPFGQIVTSKNRDAATTCLTDISQKVFQRDIEDNFKHHGWLKKWLAVIPNYIDWQIKRDAEDWRFKEAEIHSHTTLRSGQLMAGRIDRIDTDSEALAIVDYKTGRIPDKTDIELGEAVQLAHYANTLEQPVKQVEYLQLEQNGFGSKHTLVGDELHWLTSEVRQRLQSISEEITGGAPLPAWGDENSCAYCDIRGICRRDTWDATEPS